MTKLRRARLNKKRLQPTDASLTRQRPTALSAAWFTAVNSLQVGSADAVGRSLRTFARIERTQMGNPQKAGFRAEVFHTATFNARAHRLGSSLQAQLTKPGSPADVQVVKAGNVMADVQVKVCGDVADTTRAIADRRYAGMQKVVPADQVDGVRALAERRGVDGLGVRDHPAVAQEAAGVIEVNGVQSRPLTHREAQDPQLGRKLAVHELGQAAQSGALLGAAVGTSTSAYANVQAVTAGEKTLGQAAVHVARDAALAGASGAASAALTSGVTMACARAGLRVGGAPAAVVGLGFGVAKDVAALRRGDITADVLVDRGVDQAAQAGGSWGGAGVGAAVGTAVLPGVGTAVGGLIGGLVGGAGGQALASGVRQRWRARRPLHPEGAA